MPGRLCSAPLRCEVTPKRCPAVEGGPCAAFPRAMLVIAAQASEGLFTLAAVYPLLQCWTPGSVSACGLGIESSLRVGGAPW